MKFNYDPQVDALSIRFNDKPYFESDEVRDGVVFDYDNNGKIIAIEILDASKVLAKEKSRSFIQTISIDLPVRSGSRV